MAIVVINIGVFFFSFDISLIPVYNYNVLVCIQPYDQVFYIMDLIPEKSINLRSDKLNPKLI